ncbi:hypothetical protein ACFYUV_38040 [Nonomuraea sp. NPDC003560]|uniref:DUF7620 family protein n=1 Tax=Nonomuraea sp. NPDC003560 TaxID=3364341 RepID=UPI0036A4BCE9
MTPEEELQRALQEAEESRRRSLEEWSLSREVSRHARSRARRWRELREENGWEQIFDDAFGGGGA